MEGWQIAVIVVILLVAIYLYTKTEHFTDNNKPFLVLFAQNWCPACVDFKPTWDKLQKIPEVTNVINLIQLDPLPFNVGSFPTIRYYPQDPIQYPDQFTVFKGKRNLGQIMKFVRDSVISNS
jgi:thiol-disulfide isomerase/thioredoxin